MAGRDEVATARCEAATALLRVAAERFQVATGLCRVRMNRRKMATSRCKAVSRGRGAARFVEGGQLLDLPEHRVATVLQLGGEAFPRP